MTSKFKHTKEVIHTFVDDDTGEEINCYAPRIYMDDELKVEIAFN